MQIKRRNANQQMIINKCTKFKNKIIIIKIIIVIMTHHEASDQLNIYLHISNNTKINQIKILAEF